MAGIVPLTEYAGRPIGNGRPGPWAAAIREAREAWIDAASLAVAAVTRAELIARTRQLIDEGDRLVGEPVARGAPGLAPAV